MRATLVSREGCRAVLEVEVDTPRVEAHLERAYRKVVRERDIPGFRRGKAPQAVVERHLGRATLWREALEGLLADAFAEAVRLTGIEPVSDPEFEDVRMGDAPFAFKAAVDVRPEVALRDYRSIRVPVTIPEVTPEHVDRLLDALREQHSRLVTLEDGEAAPGLCAWISYEGTIGDHAVQSPAVLIELGKDELLPGVEPLLLGARAGEEREVAVTLPADLPREDLAGKDVRLRVKIHSVARKEVPALDEDFARSLGVPGAEELRSRATNRLRAAAEQQAAEQAEAKAVEAAVAQAQVPSLPASAVERRYRVLWNDWVAACQRMGIAPEEYLSRRGTTLEAFQGQLRKEAEDEVRTEFVLEEVARRENLAVSEEEVRDRLDKAGLPPAAAPAVRRSLAIQKAAAFLRELATQAPAVTQAS